MSISSQVFITISNDVWLGSHCVGGRERGWNQKTRQHSFSSLNRGARTNRTDGEEVMMQEDHSTVRPNWLFLGGRAVRGRMGGVGNGGWGFIRGKGKQILSRQEWHHWRRTSVEKEREEGEFGKRISQSHTSNSRTGHILISAGI